MSGSSGEHLKSVDTSEYAYCSENTEVQSSSSDSVYYPTFENFSDPENGKDTRENNSSSPINIPRATKELPQKQQQSDQKHDRELSTSEPLYCYNNTLDSACGHSAPEAKTLLSKEAIEEHVWLMMNSMPIQYQDKLLELKNQGGEYQHPLVKYFRETIENQLDYNNKRGSFLNSRTPHRFIMENAVSPSRASSKPPSLSIDINISSSSSSCTRDSSSDSESESEFLTPENEFFSIK